MTEHACPLCDLTFPSAWLTLHHAVKSHLTVLPMESPPLGASCVVRCVCGGAFAYYSSPAIGRGLAEHLRQHGGLTAHLLEVGLNPPHVVGEIHRSDGSVELVTRPALPTEGLE